MTTATAARCGLRPATRDDAELLFAVYASTREEELAAVPWSPEEKEAFLHMQSVAQETDYRARADTTFHVVTYDGVDVGRLYRDDGGATLHILDLALLPPWRGLGIGTAMLDALIAEATGRGVGVSLYVERYNRARELYERLGFAVVDEGPVYLKMERPAAS